MFDFFEAIENSGLVSYISGSNLLFGTFTAMHYFTLFILTGMAVVFDLHLLGLVARKQTTADFADEIFPWTWMAMGIRTISAAMELWMPKTMRGRCNLCPTRRGPSLIPTRPSSPPRSAAAAARPPGSCA